MSALFFAFGLGIAFALGAGIGVIAAGAAVRKITSKQAESTLELNHRIEDRLEKYTAHTERIAVALETISKRP
jgi:cytochrome c biogenesis protein CcdA